MNVALVVLIGSGCDIARCDEGDGGGGNSVSKVDVCCALDDFLKHCFVGGL